MNYIREQSKVIYKSKNGNDTKEFDTVDFIAMSMVKQLEEISEKIIKIRIENYKMQQKKSG